MGLDITAYSKIKLIESQNEDDVDECSWSIVKPHGLDDLAPEYEEGLYINEFSVELDMCAGSYGNYFQWRNQFAILVGYKDFTDACDNPDTSKPFTQLITYGDCEGCIGPAVAAKLAAEFKKHDADIQARAPSDYFYKKYKQWQELCELASDDGVIIFH